MFARHKSMLGSNFLFFAHPVLSLAKQRSLMVVLMLIVCFGSIIFRLENEIRGILCSLIYAGIIIFERYCWPSWVIDVLSRS